MADVKYTWKIERLNVRHDEKLGTVVTSVAWQLHGVTGVESAMEGDTTPVSEPDPKNFKGYEELTPEDVVSWLQSILGEDKVAKLKQVIADRLEAIVARVETNPQLPLPWGQ